jgi:hypothetical protein
MAVSDNQPLAVKPARPRQKSRSLKDDYRRTAVLGFARAFTTLRPVVHLTLAAPPLEAKHASCARGDEKTAGIARASQHLAQKH